MVHLDFYYLRHRINLRSSVSNRPRSWGRVGSLLLTSHIFIGHHADNATFRAGAGLAGAGSSDKIGNNVIMVGLATQVVTLVIFGAMSMEVWFRISKYNTQFNHSAEAMRNSKRFKGLLAAIITAYSTILIRCIYRIAEMAGGWQNPIMQNQASFIILDGVMCIVAVVTLNIFHPGFLFKQSYTTTKKEENDTTGIQMA